jgi:galactokinase
MHAISIPNHPGSPAAKAAQAFIDRFGGAPRLFAAPGRINIIGEHTDYSEGFVMPGAIDRLCVTAMAPNRLDRLRVVSLNRGEERDLWAHFERRGDWTDYVAGVRAALADAGFCIPGCDLVICSDVPEGAGVSSSAALEVSVMYALLAAARAAASPSDVARWAQNAEATYVGMPCGIMDQFIAANGVAGCALALDCRSLTFEPVALPADVGFLVIDSQVRHKLVDGGYAARRADCETAARLLGLNVLRDARKEMLQQVSLPERILRRARHVISENQRVGETASALARGDSAEVGRLMNTSHASLRDDFNVTCAETDMLAAIASSTPGVLGARQMGGGFGGAVLALVGRNSTDAASRSIIAAYADATGIQTNAFVCTLSGGAKEIIAAEAPQ